ncbi:MAG: hypothetical protein ACI3ZY_01075 [Parabacteroides sp.]
MKKQKISGIGLCLAALLLSYAGCQSMKSQEETTNDAATNVLPDWQAGYLDIHQISTGRGNAAFLILPDGTTMLIDAGDLGVSRGPQEIMQPMPNDSLRPAEWIVRYISHFSAPLKNGGAIDYALMTHFDNDHIGDNGPLAVEKEGFDYRLTGISHVANLLPIHKLIDRDYSNYTYPNEQHYAKEHVKNYRRFVAAREATGGRMEGFQVGSNEQFQLLKDAKAYPNFEIRNIVGNGKIWTGEGTAYKEIVPADASADLFLNENRCSCGIRITYGDFDYFSGGDIQAEDKNKPEWFDIETPVGQLLGETDVVVANHHAYSDVMFPPYVAAVRPQAFILPVWDFYHPQPTSLSNMLSKELYPGERMVFATGMVPSNLTRLGVEGEQIKPAGHVVVRVYPGGHQFQIFVLDNRSLDYLIIYQTEKLTANQ